MTQEEKAKAYDRVLERAWAMREDGYSSDEQKKTVEEFFPQLHESEDEKVRKELVEIVETTGGLSKEHTQKLLAYLEKQKESLHIPETDKENTDSFTNEDEKIRIELLKDIPNVFPYEKAFRYIHWLEKQKEQKPIIAVDSNELLKILPKPAEWSEEDDEIRKALIAFLEMNTGYFSCNGFTKDDIIQWLKSPNSQPKQEWSEEDERIIKDAIYALEEVGGYPYTVKGLKSLRLSWKPSEEQMDKLLRVASTLDAMHYKNESKVLVEFYNNLKS